MNILIVQQSLGLGGVNVVSAFLARNFLAQGHQVDVFCFYRGRNDMPLEHYGLVSLYIGHGFRVNRKNVDAIHRILVEREIQLVINQWGLPFQPTEVLRRACKGTAAKWISYYHNDPLFNGRILEVETALAKEQNYVISLFRKVQLSLTKKVTGLMLRHNYHQCWKFILLSEAYRSHFRKFTGLRNPQKLSVISNPVTIDSSTFKLDVGIKVKEIIYVGRLDPISKKIVRLVETWALLEQEFPEWHVSIVGEGPERAKIEELIAEKQLKHIRLLGQLPPKPYYERASILVLTSDFEGLPLVIGEAMTFGVIPVVYDSFDALHDVVDDGLNGIIVPKNEGTFSARDMALKLKVIMSDDEKRQIMMSNAEKRSHDFRFPTIYKKWEMLFKELRDESRQA